MKTLMILIILIGLLVSGCATIQFNKPNLEQGQLLRDKGDCLDVPVVYPYIRYFPEAMLFVNMSSWIASQEIWESNFAECMKLKGYIKK